MSLPVWPDLAIFCTLGNFLKPLATINLPKSLTILSNICKGVKIYHFSCEIIPGQLLQTFGGFYLVTLVTPMLFKQTLFTLSQINSTLLKVFKMGHSQPLYYLFSSFPQLTVNIFRIKFCQRLDLNRRPLILEAITMSTESQPLPHSV